LTDDVGGADGELFGGAELDGNGEVAFDSIDDYADLPNGLLGGLTEVTFMGWVRRFGGPAYVRIWDFGTSSEGEDPAEGSGSIGISYIALTPATGFVPSGLAGLVTVMGGPNETVAASDVNLDDELHQVALVVRGAQFIALYVDGVLQVRLPTPAAVADVDDVNNWLGRSQFDNDPYFHGGYSEFRLYSQALSDCQVLRANQLGPDSP
jgi:hypothetical protein